MYCLFNKKNLPNLIFLHGWGGCWQSWYPILKSLKKEYNLFALDLPGFGQTPLSRPYNLIDYSTYVSNFINENNIKNPILIGHSFGGAIACQYTIDNPDKASRLVLVDAAPIRYKLSLKQQTIIFITQTTKIILSTPFFRCFFEPAKKILYKTLKLENSGYADLNNPTLKKTFSNIIREDLSSKLSLIKTPTLLIWGENDLDTPLLAGKKIAQLISNSKLIIFPNLGHFAYLDNQKKFIREIKKFITNEN